MKVALLPAASDNATFSNETGDSNTTVFNTTVESDISMSNDTVYSSRTDASFNRISIPAIAFRNISDNKTGVIFSSYATDILFPLRLNQSQNDTYKAIGSNVLSGTVAGENIQGLKQPINISMSIIVSVSYTYTQCLKIAFFYVFLFQSRTGQIQCVCPTTLVRVMVIGQLVAA
ncbi:hypothetical protein GBAR_LOCUS25785 [Geodia barretti]|uniref:Uncharacterized protein n=1 Tax=Geodia barretti TaxID=519541 RepID=A0AA35XDA2_GEOBA|nr:hypothetical protein GBAR_LOCUS25785 [Geodia barretti]